MVEGCAVGRIVHFVTEDGGVAPAIITRVWDKQTGYVNLTVFPDDETEIRRETSRYYSEAKTPQTWHWPVRS